MRQFENFITNFFQTEDDFLVNIYEDNEKYIVLVFLPGIKKECINVMYQDDILSIYLNSSINNQYDDYKKVRIEQRDFKKMRSFNLPRIKLKETNASFKDGLLKLTLHKEHLIEESFSIKLE